MNTLHIISIVLEGGIFVLGLMMALLRKKIYGWGFAVTFGVYVFYDLAKFLALPLAGNFLYVVFFIATVSIFLTAWAIYREE